MNKIYLALMTPVIFAASCSADAKQSDNNVMNNETETIYFAGGCFWGTEHFMRQIEGVTATETGYANSVTPYPSYKEVCTGRTGAAETVKVDYDPAKVTPEFLIELYLMTVDPTSVNKQGNDVGTQYRTGIYYTTELQKLEAEKALAALSREYVKPIAIELKPIENFYPAEDYHQDYLENNPGGYCHIDPRLFEVARKAKMKKTADYSAPSDSVLRNRLTPMQYEVTQNAATEPPFRNEYWDNHRKGLYVDITTGEPLFVSTDKFDSGCGWPSFSRPLPGASVVEKEDRSHGMVRTEVRSGKGDTHLGHVFNDGPKESGGLRYCINSASLRFIPLDEMEKEGYADYVKYVK